jgi:hypothetical protein
MWIKELQMQQELDIQSVVCKTSNENYRQWRVVNFIWHALMQYQVMIQKFDEKIKSNFKTSFKNCKTSL